MFKPLGPAFIVAGFCLIGWALLRAFLYLETHFSHDLGPYARQMTQLLIKPEHPGIAGAFWAGILMIVIGYLFIPRRE